MPPVELDPLADREPRLLCCTGRWRSLGEVRAAEAYGVDCKRSNIELATWTRRLAHELDAFEPLGVLVPDVPRGVAQHVARARSGFRLLIGLRWADGPQRPVAFSVRFASAWCSLTFRDAREALGDLQALGVIQRAGAAGPGNRTPLYLPGKRR